MYFSFLFLRKLTGGQNFGPRNFRPGLSARAEFPVIFRTEMKFLHDFRASPKNSPEIRTKLKRTHHINDYKKHSVEQYVVVPSSMSQCRAVRRSAEQYVAVPSSTS
jgi:hypothetical protein